MDSLPRSIAAFTAAAPALVIRLPLESPGTITFEAGTCEDEQRLRVWLRGSRRLDEVVANVLYALETVGEPWELMLTCACTYCGGPGAWLRAVDSRVDVNCPAGCDSRAFTQALLGRLSEKEESHGR